MPAVTSFSLVDEPCILVGLHDGSTCELSLRDTFARASDIRELRGSPQTQVFAQLRFLEAILLRALELDEGPERDAPPAERWRRLWTADELPMPAIARYLDEHRDRFDLIGSQPLMQVAALRTAKSDTPEGSSLSRLVVDSSDDGLFSMRRAGGLTRLTFAEAARELLHVHAFGVSGIYPAGMDDTGTDPRAKGGKVYPQGVGAAGDLGGVMIEGGNLRETLLLNLVLGRSASEPFDYTVDDEPAWERPQLTVTEEERSVPGPHGPADLFTWQSRRVRLIHDDDGVTGAVVCYGDQLRPQNLHTIETMSAYRYSANQSKALGGTVYMPVRHQPSRSFWRGLGALLPQERSDGPETIPPRTIEWIRDLSDRGILADDRILTTRAIGVEYGTQSSVITEIYGDGVDMQVALLQERNRSLADAVLEMVSRTDDAMRAVGWLAENLVIAAGGDPLEAAKSARDAEKANGYALVDGPFRAWLRRLGSGTDVEEARTAWVSRARELLRGHAQRMVRDAGVAAWRGRPRGAGGEELINAPKAFVWFDRQLGKALPPGRDERVADPDARDNEKESA